MTWYEEAVKSMGEGVIDICYDDDAPLGRKAINVEKAAAIIAAHDPNRWIPVEERLPPLDSFNHLKSNWRLVIQKGRKHPVYAYWTRYGCWQGHPYSTDIVPDVTHGRENVLPEVKG